MDFNRKALEDRLQGKLVSLEAFAIICDREGHPDLAKEALAAVRVLEEAKDDRE